MLFSRFISKFATYKTGGFLHMKLNNRLLLEHISYRALFPYAVFFSALAFLTMTQMRHWNSRPVKKQSALEHFDVDDSKKGRV